MDTPCKLFSWESCLGAWAMAWASSVLSTCSVASQAMQHQQGVCRGLLNLSLRVIVVGSGSHKVRGAAPEVFTSFGVNEGYGE